MTLVEQSGWPSVQDFPEFVGATLELRDYPDYGPGFDNHTHCATCFHEIVPPSEYDKHVGENPYVRAYLLEWEFEWEGKKEPREDWICPDCIAKYRDRFSWTLVQEKE